MRRKGIRRSLAKAKLVKEEDPSRDNPRPDVGPKVSRKGEELAKEKARSTKTIFAAIA